MTVIESRRMCILPHSVNQAHGCHLDNLPTQLGLNVIFIEDESSSLRSILERISDRSLRIVVAVESREIAEFCSLNQVKTYELQVVSMLEVFQSLLRC